MALGLAMVALLACYRRPTTPLDPLRFSLTLLLFLFLDPIPAGLWAISAGVTPQGIENFPLHRGEEHPTKIDLNTASLTDLEALPGIDLAMAKRIIAGRPYASVQDLAKAGLPTEIIASLAPRVTVNYPPADVMVWVDPDTMVFHPAGDPWYGKTKHGKLMSKTAALAAGASPSPPSSPTAGGRYPNLHSTWAL